MADGVLYLPSATLVRKIDSLTDPGTGDLIELLIEHHDSGCDRSPLARAVAEGRFSSRAHGHDILRVLEWASDKCFEIEGADESDTPEFLSTETSPADERLAEISRMAFAQAEAEGQLEKAFRRLGEAERFPEFPPSWGLDTATWDRTFGRHDPIPVIAFHLAKFFETENSSRSFTTMGLSSADISLWDHVITELSAIPWKVRYGEDELTEGQKARSLRSALGLPDEFGSALSLTDPDLAEIIGMSPGWMASQLIDWWATEDIAWSRSNEEGADRLIAEQVVMIYRIMIRHLVDWHGLDEGELHEDYSVEAADLEELPEYFPTAARSYERLIEAFWDAVDDWGDLHWYRTSLTKAVYHARNRVFRNRFPFPADAILALAELRGEEGYWLADFSAASHSPRPIFPYLSFLTEVLSSDPWIARLQLTELARRRLEVYEAALQEMLDESHLELARAWWAFFMASQSQMFSALGLGAQETRRIIRIAEGLLPDEGVEKAFAFVRAMAEDLEDPLDRRTVLDLLPSRSGGEVVEMPNPSADEFLATRISAEVWEQLHPDTRQDIRDAELLWERAFRQLGAGRVDWGGLGVIYARAIERELKTHLVPKLEMMRERGIIASRKTATLGSILKACEEAGSAIAASPEAENDEVDAFIARLDQAFRNELKVVGTIRNRAAHGDRGNPVVHVEFMELRAAILEQGAFRTILLGP